MTSGFGGTIHDVVDAGIGSGGAISIRALRPADERDWLASARDVDDQDRKWVPVLDLSMLEIYARQHCTLPVLPAPLIGVLGICVDEVVIGELTWQLTDNGRGDLTHVKLIYWIRRARRGQGVTSTAVELLIHAVEASTIQVSAFVADVRPENTASERLLSRLGFTTSDASTSGDPRLWLRSARGGA
jgi:RimJ/RimL family protein N-acetyltransferase